MTPHELVTLPGKPESDITGIVLAMGIEAGALLDRMQQTRTTQGNGFKYHRGLLCGNNYVLVESGIGYEKALAATDNLASVFFPGRIISAGFAGALDPQMGRNAIYWPSQILHGNQSMKIPGASHPQTLVTAGHVVDTVEKKRQLREATGADLVDMESFAVAEYCREKRISFQSLRVVLDLADEELPREINRITSPQSQGYARKFGLIAGAIFKRPSCVFDLYQLKERALVAADRLAMELEDYALEHPLIL